MLSGYNGEVTLHGPYLNLVPTSIDKRVREVAEYRYLQAVDAAVKLGARQLVIHSFMIQQQVMQDMMSFG